MLYSIDISEMPPLVRDFASYKSAIQNCSVKTVSEYLLDLRTFFRFLIADRQGISPESEEFLKIDISSLDLEFMKSITGSRSTCPLFGVVSVVCGVVCYLSGYTLARRPSVGR